MFTTATGGEEEVAIGLIVGVTCGVLGVVILIVLVTVVIVILAVKKKSHPVFYIKK